MSSPERTLRVTVGVEAMAVILGAIAFGVFCFGVATAASRTLGWAVACAVVAALIDPLVRMLSRRIARPLAILAVLLVVGGAAVGLTRRVVVDLGNQFDRLKVAAPAAAAQLEESERFGQRAADFRLRKRIGEVLAEVEKPSSGLAPVAPAATGTYLLCAVLVAFFLSWGPRLGRSAVEQLSDDTSRERLRSVSHTAFANARRYAFGALSRSAVAGTAAYGLCRAADVPAEVVLAVAVAGFAVVPGFGILVGALPTLLLKAGLDPGGGAALLLAAFVALQALDELVLRRLVRPVSLNVGPAVIVVAMVVGFEVYGVGGAYYGTALAVFGVAALDATADATADEEEAMVASHEGPQPRPHRPLR